MKRIFCLIMVFVAVFALASCSKKKSHDYKEQVTKEIPAEEGGTITTSDESISIEIPADALDSNTEITMKVYKASDYPGTEDKTVISHVVEFEPSGTIFKKPVFISMISTGTAEKLRSVKKKVITAAVFNEKTGDWSYSPTGAAVKITGKDESGDPIMTTAAGDPIMLNAAGDPIMMNAAGDPIMLSAAGDPIMVTAAGDPIMNAAAGDPIMMTTGHFTAYTFILIEIEDEQDEPEDDTADDAEPDDDTESDDNAEPDDDAESDDNAEPDDDADHEPVYVPECGNGIVDEGEECDKGEANGATDCASGGTECVLCSTECRFTCRENYTLSHSKCVADSKTSSCTNLPENADWNTVSEITQTWSGSEWLPSATGVFNEEASAGECRFKCRENYSWKDSQCVANTQAATCTDLPENADWNTVSEITQTWSGSEWLPSATTAFNEEASAGECRFKCKENYSWRDSQCVADTRVAACTGLPSNAQWNTVSEITQTWSGSEWLPSSTIAFYSREDNGEACSFRCLDSCKWDGKWCLPECSPTSGTPCRDSTSGLTWSSRSDQMYWSSAESYCENLTEGNHDDWKMPNIDELRTVIRNCDNTQTGGACAVSEPDHLSSSDNSRNCSCDSIQNNEGYYSKLGDEDAITLWSSSVRSDDTNSAWCITFTSAYILNLNKSGYSRNVRCIRPTEPECSPTSGTPCRDSTSGLTWSSRSDQMYWTSAESYCENLTEGDYSDWRLPNIDELRTVIRNCDNTQTGGACAISDPDHLSSSDNKNCSCDSIQNNEGYYSKLGDEDAITLWSSSVRSDDTNSAWCITFTSAYILNLNKSGYSRNVRCVRSAE